jgi:hypothetical protein
VVVDAFMDGLHAGCLTAAAVCLVGAVAVAVLLPSRPQAGTADPAATEPVTANA